jgi:hypothetical protein
MADRIDMSVDGELQLEELAAAERAEEGAPARLRSMDKRKVLLHVLTWARIVLLPLAGIVYWVSGLVLSRCLASVSLPATCVCRLVHGACDPSGWTMESA